MFQVKDLSVEYHSQREKVRAIDGISFEIQRGETLGIVGESGCGKSTVPLACLGLLPPAGRVFSGEARYNDVNLFSATEKELRSIRGNKISIVFQDPLTGLNPYRRIGSQVSEVIEWHKGVGRKESQKRAIEILQNVGIREAEKLYQSWPHEFSGGMRQRVMIAMALACEPDLLIADEPTTALDVTLQAQILKLIRDQQQKKGLGMMLITHDLGVVAHVCDRMAVMYAGKIVEQGRVAEVLAQPSHPYTQALLECLPHLRSEESQKMKPISGSPPKLKGQAKKCSFQDRCTFAQDKCTEEVPVLRRVSEHHEVACFHPLNMEG